MVILRTFYFLTAKVMIKKFIPDRGILTQPSIFCYLILLWNYLCLVKYLFQVLHEKNKVIRTEWWRKKNFLKLDFHLAIFVDLNCFDLVSFCNDCSYCPGERRPSLFESPRKHTTFMILYYEYFIFIYELLNRLHTVAI